MGKPVLSRLHLENFTVFRELDLEFSAGVNVFIGPNGTGKTHLLKLLYGACQVTWKGAHLPQKLVDDFKPLEGRIGRLVHRYQGGATAAFTIGRGDHELTASFTNRARNPANVQCSAGLFEPQQPIPCAFIPVKDILAWASDLLSYTTTHATAIEAHYTELITQAYLPPLKGRMDRRRKDLMARLRNVLDGRVEERSGTFYLVGPAGDLEFSLLAEGLRKLALFWLLIQNGTLLEGSVLFCDEPEANLHPQAIDTLIEVLYALAQSGTQVFLSTHSYLVLKKLELLSRRDRDPEKNPVRVHSLEPAAEGIRATPSDLLDGLPDNPILDAELRLFRDELELDLEMAHDHPG